MKKTIFTLFVIVLSSAATFAQLSGGLKAGVNITNQKYSISGESQTYNGTSFHIGAYGNFALSETISIQPELLYNSIKIDVEGEDFTSNYLSVPVMLVYGIADNKFNLQAGPQIGLLLSTDPSEVKDAEYYSSTDLTMNLGAGANFGKFNVAIRYGIGLGNIAGGLWDDLGFGDMKIKNNNLQISVGYKLFGE